VAYTAAVPSCGRRTDGGGGRKRAFVAGFGVRPSPAGSRGPRPWPVRQDVAGVRCMITSSDWVSVGWIGMYEFESSGQPVQCFVEYSAP